MTLSDLIPGVPQAKLVLAGIMLALFAVPTVGLVITRHTLANVREWQGEVIAATGEASHLPPGKHFDPKVVPAQIREFGTALDKVEAAGITARNAELGRNHRVETAQTNASMETGNAIDTERASANAAAAAYIRGMRDARARAADRGGPGGPGAPAKTGNAASVLNGAGGVPVMDDDDVRVCTDNTVKARGWQAYNAGQDAALTKAGAN